MTVLGKREGLQANRSIVFGAYMEAHQPIRVKYFGSEYLLTADFNRDQHYHKYSREDFNGGVFKSGVIRGLKVQLDESNDPLSIVVTSGMAMDGSGQSIVQTEDNSFPIPDAVDEKCYLLTVQYSDSAVVGTPKQTVESAVFAWTESKSYVPSDADVFLAAVQIYSGKVSKVLSQYGGFVRQHIGAALGEVTFIPSGNASLPSALSLTPDETSMSIAARNDTNGDPYLEIAAPTIHLDGKVEMSDGQFSGNFQGTATLSGNFSGKFFGSGAGLTDLPPPSPVQPQDVNYWTQAGSNLYYTTGNVGIGVSNPAARLTVDGSSGQQISSGIVTLDPDKVTLRGAQTSFTTELDNGDVLTFGSVREQEAVIQSVDGDNKLTLSEPFGLSVGWCPVVLRSGGETKQGSGRFLAEGTTVKGDKDTKFKSELKDGDSLVIASFVPKKSIGQWAVTDKPTSDTEVKVTPLSPHDGAEYPIGSVFSVSRSGYALEVTGGAEIDSLDVTDSLTAMQATITKNISVDGQLTAASASVTGQVSAQELSIGSSFQVSETAGVQCFSTVNSLVPVPTGVGWIGVYGPMPSDAIVSMCNVPMSDGKLATPTGNMVYVPFIIASQGTFGTLQGWTNSGPVVNYSTLPPYKAYARADVSTFPLGNGSYALQSSTITMPVKKGDFFAYYFTVPNGAPANLGLYFSVTYLGAPDGMPPSDDFEANPLHGGKPG